MMGTSVGSWEAAGGKLVTLNGFEFMKLPVPAVANSWFEITETSGDGVKIEGPDEHGYLKVLNEAQVRRQVRVEWFHRCQRLFRYNGGRARCERTVRSAANHLPTVCEGTAVDGPQANTTVSETGCPTCGNSFRSPRCGATGH